MLEFPFIFIIFKTMKKLKFNYEDNDLSIFKRDSVASPGEPISEYRPKIVQKMPIVKTIFNYPFFWFLRNRLINTMNLFIEENDIQMVNSLKEAIAVIDDIDFDNAQEIADFLNEYNEEIVNNEDIGPEVIDLFTSTTMDPVINTLKFYSELN